MLEHGLSVLGLELTLDRFQVLFRTAWYSQFHV